ncbi:class I SAM-dependent methyltransferase [Sphingomonas sp.]|uniref:class I SAM-dependent methyltransferase n=1 Tax=Sphingomonas sp. TaxID=28214 RepID=UPI003B009FB8
MSHFVARQACPVCGETGFEAVYEAPYRGDPVRGFLDSHYADQGFVDWSLFGDEAYEVVHCPRCDLLFQRLVPDDALLARIYTEMTQHERVAAIERAMVTRDSVDKVAGEFAHLFRLTGKPIADITVLDYGLGFGRWARVARGLGATVYATEIGEEKRQLARSLGIEVIDDADIDAMQFDIVHTEQVMEHLIEPGRDFARLARATRHLLKAAVPARGRAGELLRSRGLPAVSPYRRAAQGERMGRDDDAFISIQPLEHLNAYSATTMRWLGEHNGLALASRVRLGTVSVDMTSPKRLLGSLKQLGTMAAKATLRPDRGYYLFRRAA